MPDTYAEPVEEIDWSHQPAAIDAAATVLSDNLRTTIVAACGAGKTRIGAGIAARFLERDDSLLLILPTIDLLSQTLVEYAQLLGPDALGTLIAVCSDVNVARRARAELDLDRIGAHVTTDPEALARLLAGPGRKTVAATYQSLFVLERAHQKHGLDPWAFSIADEAHRTAGVPGKPWSAINDDDRIPCRRRLYLTATPRVFADDGSMVSMDDEKTYGPVAYTYTFAQGIDAGVLVDYRLVVPVITDGELHELATGAMKDATYWSAAGGAAVTPQILATQLALLRAAHETGAKRLVSFHTTIRAARSFALTLKNAAQLLPPDQQPVSLTARHISGYHNGEQRRALLDVLRSTDPGLVLLANAKVMAEGVNIPDIDGVAFIDPRGSIESVIQAVGRALRSAGRRDKTATIVVPVLLGPDDTPETALAGSAYNHVWRAVQALSAYDERLENWLRTRPQHDPPPSEERALYRTSRDAIPRWLNFVGAPVPNGFVEAMQLRMLRPRYATWVEHYAQAKAFHEKNGHLNVAREQDAKLLTWLRNQRSLRQRGELANERVALLEQLGIIWRILDATWQHALTVAQVFHAEHGHLNSSRGELFGQPPIDLSDWLKKQRLSRRAGKLTDDQIGALDALGLVWDPNQETWERGLAAARAFHSEHGHLSVPEEPDRYLYNWIARRRADYAKDIIAPDRIAALEELGIVWRPNDRAWETGFAAAQAYHQIHGHLQTTLETVIGEPPYAVGRWINNQRNRYRDKALADEQTARLEALGIDWNPVRDAWALGTEAAREYYTKHGHLRVQPGDRFLHRWLGDQREKYAGGRLPHDRIAELEALGISWRPLQDEWNRVYRLAAAYFRREGHLIPGGSEVVGDPPIQLTQWLTAQRVRRASSTMPPERVELLEEIGMVWDHRDGAWQRGLAAARAFHERHGHLDAVLTDTIGDPPYPLGSWLSTARKAHRQGKLAPTRIADLDALGVNWEPGRGGTRASRTKNRSRTEPKAVAQQLEIATAPGLPRPDTRAIVLAPPTDMDTRLIADQGGNEAQLSSPATSTGMAIR